MIKLALQISVSIFAYTTLTSGIIAGITVLAPITMSIISLTVLGFK